MSNNPTKEELQELAKKHFMDKVNIIRSFPRDHEIAKANSRLFDQDLDGESLRTPAQALVLLKGFFKFSIKVDIFSGGQSLHFEDSGYENIEGVLTMNLTQGYLTAPSNIVGSSGRYQFVGIAAGASASVLTLVDDDNRLMGVFAGIGIGLGKGTAYGKFNSQWRVSN